MIGCSKNNPIKLMNHKTAYYHTDQETDQEISTEIFQESNGAAHLKKNRLKAYL